MIVSVHLTLGGHVAQRINRFHAHSRVLIVHQRIKQRLANQVLRFGAVESFERLQSHRRIVIRVDRLAECRTYIRIVVARTQQIHCIQSYIRIETLIIVQHVHQHALDVIIIHGAGYHERLLCPHLQLHARRLVIRRWKHVDSRHISSVKIERAERRGRSNVRTVVYGLSR